MSKVISTPTTQEDIRFRALVETAVDGVIVIDSKGLIQMFNPACERLFGYRAQEVMGSNVKNADARQVSTRT